MDLFTLYTLWLTSFSIGFTFLPLFLVFEWRKRGTAEGFSSINFVLPLLMMSCWCRHGLMTNDKVNIYLNAVNLVIFSLYIVAFAIYQPQRKYLYGQLITLFITVYFLFHHVDSYPAPERADKMAAIAATTQIIGLAGGIYDIVRAIKLRTSEFIPAQIQFGILALTIQWTIFGLLIGNYYMALANIAGLIVNLATISLYFIYPPLTWRVPIIGTGGKAKVEKKKE